MVEVVHHVAMVNNQIAVKLHAMIVNRHTIKEREHVEFVYREAMDTNQIAVKVHAFRGQFGTNGLQINDVIYGVNGEEDEDVLTGSFLLHLLENYQIVYWVVIMLIQMDQIL